MTTSRQAMTIKRCLSLLATLGDAGQAGASFTSLRSILGCGDASLSRLLANLQELGLIDSVNGYRLSPAATGLAGRICGQNDPEPRLRAALARLSDFLRASTAIFDVLPTGVRCRLRHLRPDGVGFIAEGVVRQQLYGHGVGVVACAYDDGAQDWHGQVLCNFLGHGAVQWRRLLASIRRRGWYAPFGAEGGIQDGVVEPTLVRLTIPILYGDRLQAVFCATTHGLSREAVFTDSAITVIQDMIRKMTADYVRFADPLAADGTLASAQLA